jgi:hypothetical protein
LACGLTERTSLTTCPTFLIRAVGNNNNSNLINNMIKKKKAIEFTKDVLFPVLTIIAAIYFGFKQHSIETKLLTIEEFNHKQELLKEQIDTQKAENELGNLTDGIITLLKDRKIEFVNLNTEEREKYDLQMIAKMKKLLILGLNNKIVVNNKEVLTIWKDSKVYVEMFKTTLRNGIKKSKHPEIVKIVKENDFGGIDAQMRRIETKLSLNVFSRAIER